MKILLSKKKRGEKRHVVLLCDRSEAFEIHTLLYEDVLHREVVPHRETFRDGSGRVRYRFAMKYLERLMLTFPFADFSPGLESNLSTKARAELEAMEVPELEIEDFRGELYDFQKISTHKMMTKKRFLLNDEMGLGKSVQLLAAIVARQSYPALLVVPNGIKFNWERMGEQFTDCTFSVVDGTAQEKRAALAKDADITIVNCEALRVSVKWDDDVCSDPHCSVQGLHNHQWYEFKNPGIFFEDDTVRMVRDDQLPDEERRWWSLIGVDEYHRFKNPEAQQTVGLHMLHAPRQYAMSGTPLLNGRPEELWSILHWMWPKKFDTYDNFVKNHCVKKGSSVIAYRGLEEVRDFFQARNIRRRKEQVLDQLPEVVYVDRYVDLTAEQRRLYNEIRDELRLWIDEQPRAIVTTLAQLTRLKQACFSPELYDGSPHSAKLDDLKEVVAELAASGEKAIIFSQWSKATRIMERELAQYNPAYIDGSVKVRDRMAQIDKFNNEEDCKVFIGTIGSCKEGFTLSAGTYVIHMDEGWVPADKMQATARSASGGLRGVDSSATHVHVITIRANNTFEEDIDALLNRKQQMNDRMVEKDGGANVERITIQDIRELLDR